MKNTTRILILILFLLLIPTSNVFACDNSTKKEKTEKTSCSKEVDHSEMKSCCDKDEKHNGSCDGTCDNSSCHCPSSINTIVFFKNVDLKFDNNFKLLLNDWTYVQKNPKAIYLSIWQPPKIS